MTISQLTQLHGLLCFMIAMLYPLSFVYSFVYLNTLLLYCIVAGKHGLSFVFTAQV